MGFFAWLFGRNPIREFSPERLGWTTDVVGELHYQAEIERQYRSHGGTEGDAKGGRKGRREVLDLTTLLGVLLAGDMQIPACREFTS